MKIGVARVFNNNGDGSPFSVIYAGVGYLIDQKVNVINLSLGGFGQDDLATATIARAIAANIVVVAAAGNDSTNVPFYPGNLPGVINVSAVGPDKERSFFSNYGGTVAIAAPGGDDETFADVGRNIVSTYVRGVTSTPPTGINGYGAEQGTSQACPHVSGAVCLLLAAGAAQNPATIKQILQDNAQPLPDNSGLNYFGSGLLDVYSALLTVADPPFVASLNGAQDLGSFYTSQVRPLSITVSGVTKAPAGGVVKLIVYALPNDVAYTFVEGTDFSIPRTIPNDQPKATPFTVQVPANGKIELAPGRYKVVLTVNDVPQGTQFFDVIAQNQPRGRTMFAYPFRVREVNSTSPEQTVFGFSTTFSLARYNTLRTQQSAGDYFLWQSGGVKERGASFSAIAGTTTTGGELPFVVEAANQSVSIAPVGLGYWLDLNDTVRLNTVGSPVTTPVYVNLYAANGGWNMVGAPFTGATGWGTVSVQKDGVVYGLDEAIRRSYIASALIGYENGDYVYSIYPYGEMQPFKGYWVKAYTDCTLVIAPTSSSRKVAAPVKRGLPTVDGWRARLSARVSGDSDGQNYFGQAKGAADGADTLDVLKPPTGNGHSYLRFVADKDSTKAANAFDMRSPDSAKAEWTAAVSSDRTNADVTVTWDNLGAAPRRAGFTLTDTASGAKVDMRARSSYTFRSGDAGSTRYLKVSMTPTLSGGPLTITGMSVVGGRSKSDAGFTVRFATTAEAEISGAVKSLSGKTVAELSGASRATAGGANTLRWDGRAKSGGVVPPGPYLVEVTARSADGQTAKFVQPIQNLR